MISDAKSTGEDTEIESVKVLDDDMDSLAAISVYQESDNNESLRCQLNSIKLIPLKGLEWIRNFSAFATFI